MARQKDMAPEGAPHRTNYLTGVRPSGDATVANLMAIKPVVDLQQRGTTRVFVADMHATTTGSVEDAKTHTRDLARDFLAMGLDPKRADLYKQSDLRGEVSEMTLALNRFVSVAELTRQPALKDKIKGDPEAAPVSLAQYPVMMTSDIVLQDARRVPVGEDQVPHIELARNIVDRVNRSHGPVLAKPEAYEGDEPPPRYLGLRGGGKMSKSDPEGAILLSDSSEEVRRKIRRAVTANPGESTPELESHLALAKRLAPDQDTIDELDALYQEHLDGGRVMGDFKRVFTDAATNFLDQHASRRRQFPNDVVEDVLAEGGRKARATAQEVIGRMRRSGAMF